MRLNEEDANTLLFGSEQLKLISKVRGQSSLLSLRFNGLSDKEQRAIERLVKNVKNNAQGKNNCNDFCVLTALLQGPDSSKNALIRYVMQAPVNAWRTSDKVLLSLELGSKGNKGVSLVSDDKLLPCLLNDNVYTDRSLAEFRYTLMAFDAILNKKSQYFDGDAVKVSLSDSKFKEFFNSEQVEEPKQEPFEQETPNNIILFPGRKAQESLSLYEASAWKLRTVKIDVKYLYEGYKIENSDRILPASVNQTSDQRTIWNYMELWSNPIDESTDNKAARSNNQSNQLRKELRQKIVDQITDRVENSNMNKLTQEEIIDLLSRMP